MSETMQEVTAILAFLTVVLNAVMGYLYTRLNAKADKTAGLAQKAVNLANGNLDAVRAERDLAQQKYAALVAALPADFEANHARAQQLANAKSNQTRLN